MIAVMLGVSLVLGLFGLLAFIWGLKNGQFDDANKMMQGVLFDSVEDLNLAAKTDKKQKTEQNTEEVQNNAAKLAAAKKKRKR